MRLASAALLFFTLSLAAQDAVMTIQEYDPKSTLVVPEHPRPRAKYPFIDIHGHQDELAADAAAKLIGEMDSLNLQVMVNLSGGSGDAFKRRDGALRGRYAKRFVTFANVDFKKIDEPDFGANAARQLEEDVRNGAAGLKVFKDLGMFVRDAAGNRVHTDDPRLDPIWEKAAELHIPVLIHTGEPASFWKPVDKYNERYMELTELPGRRRSDPKFASFETTMEEQHNLFRRHPRTTFIAAHLGWSGHDLAALGKLLDELPNMNVDIAAVLYELGRQPRAARAFLVKYQDRVLMGKDTWSAAEFPTYFRVLETEDEYFDYYRRRHAFWKMYGLGLPDAVLKKIYYKNALRLVPAIDRSGFPE
jgi:predicted TIM-barrel fold metal-dependent hydrolase